MAKYSNQTYEAKKNIDKLASALRKAIWIGTLVIPIFALWLLSSSEIFQPLLQTLDPQLLRRLSLTLYYVSVVYGSLVDISVMRDAFTADSSEGTVSPLEWTMFVLFCVAAVVLFIATIWSDAVFLLIFAGFVITQTVGGFFIDRRVGSIVSESIKEIEENRDDLFVREKLDRVRTYRIGAWTRRRIAVQAILLSAVLVVGFAEQLRTALAQWLTSIITNLTTSAIYSLLPSAAVLVFIIAGEGWQWVKRVDITAAVRVLDQLALRYRLIRSQG